MPYLPGMGGGLVFERKSKQDTVPAYDMASADFVSPVAPTVRGSVVRFPSKFGLLCQSSALTLGHGLVLAT